MTNKRYYVVGATGALGNAFFVEGSGRLGGVRRVGIMVSVAGVIVVTVSFRLAVGAVCRARDDGGKVEARVGGVSIGSGGGERGARRGGGYAGGPARAGVAPVPDPGGLFGGVHFVFCIIYIYIFILRKRKEDKRGACVDLKRMNWWIFEVVEEEQEEGC